MRPRIFLCLLLNSLAGWSQKISVMDRSNHPLPFAHVIYEGMNGEDKTVLLTDEKGVVEVIPSFLSRHSTYQLTISYIGYEIITDTILDRKNRSYHLKSDKVSLNQLVVTAQYAPNNPERAVHKVKIIDRKRIEAQAAVNLEDVLQQETNMRISQDNILGSGLSMQGISSQNVKILVDGVPVIGRLDGNIDLSQINLNNVERIEIIEGPLSVNYGTDALAGTINIITKDKQKKPLEASMNSYYETVGQYNMDGRIGIRRKNHAITLSGGRNYFDGWSAKDKLTLLPKSLPADTNRNQQWKPKEQHFAKLQYNYQRKKISYRPYLEYFQEIITNRGTPRTPYYETAFDDRYSTLRFNKGLAISSKIAAHRNIAVLIAHNHFMRIKNSFYKDLTNLQQVLTESPSDQDTSKFQLWMSRGSFSTSRDSTFINYELGYDLNFETTTGRRIEGKDKEIGDYAIYSSAEITLIKSIIVRPGLRLTYNTTYNAPLIPSINARYIIRNVTIRASYARGFRAPSLKELHYNFVDINHNIHGNTSLKAETSHNYQLHLRWQQRRAQHLLKMEVGGYFNDTEELISLAQASPATSKYTYINIGKYKTIGFQTNLEHAYKHLKLSLGGAYIGRYNSISEKQAVDPYSYSPEMNCGILAELHKIHASISAFYKYTGSLPGFYTDAENNVDQSTIAAYHTMDINFTKYLWKKRLQWTVGSKNLFDVTTISSTSSSQGTHNNGSGNVPVSWGRTYFTSFKINL